MLTALGVAGLASGFLVAKGGAVAAAAKPTKITVTVGKPSEFRFTLSKRSVPVGTTVVFKVVNQGKISHDFFIQGKKTPTLAPGKSAKVKVTFKKKGRYFYVCTIPGHASAGMQGKFAVGVKPTKTTPPPTTTTVTTTTTTPTITGPVGNANTTVNVDMFEYRFALSQSTIPSGQVTFVIVNRGSEVHNFSINGVRAGKILSPGQSETWTVGLPANSYNYVCDVPFHADRGMIGSFTVTP
jgi:uncharacterized cupredoxin-like copper-binding protein